MTAASRLIKHLRCHIPPFRSIDEIDYVNIINFFCPPSEIAPRQSCRKALAFNFVAEDGVEDILFGGQGRILEILCRQCCDTDIQAPGQALLFLCDYVLTDRYRLCVDKALVSLLERIPVEGIFKKSHRKDFRTFRKKLTK
jgi:hypothetical protein